VRSTYEKYCARGKFNKVTTRLNLNSHVLSENHFGAVSSSPRVLCICIEYTSTHAGGCVWGVCACVCVCVFACKRAYTQCIEFRKHRKFPPHNIFFCRRLGLV